MASPKAWNYGDYNGYGNYGAHTMAFTDARGITYWFSYKTLIAFSSPTTGKVVHQNIWTATTGKHLNWIDYGNKVDRVSSDEFERLLAKAVA